MQEREERAKMQEEMALPGRHSDELKRKNAELEDMMRKVEVELKRKNNEELEKREVELKRKNKRRWK